MCFKNDKKWIDIGGGYGVLTRLMCDIGIDFYWDDPYKENLFAKSFAASKLDKKEFVSVSAFKFLSMYLILSNLYKI